MTDSYSKPTSTLNINLAASGPVTVPSGDGMKFGLTGLPQTIRIESEHMRITLPPAGDILTVDRGVDGTTAATHTKGSGTGDIYIMGPCGAFADCPWGLDLDRLYVFKVDVSSQITPGNFGAITACGTGIQDYRGCINGQAVSGFFPEGETVNVGPATGSGGIATNAALNERYATEGADGVYECDVEATPDAATGLDPDGKALAKARFTQSGCNYRLVAVPILQRFPTGSSEAILVLGVATFGIAKWDRQAPWDNLIGWDLGATKKACNTPNPGNEPGLKCGMVWGYLDKDWRMPAFLLQRIDPDSQNPLAPLLIAMIE